MNSSDKAYELTFRVLHDRLLAFVNARIKNGECSERLLARTLGISQSQLHNVLKGKRKLQVSLADALLARFAISVLDLLSQGEPRRRGKPAPDAMSLDAGAWQQESFLPQIAGDTYRKRAGSVEESSKQKRAAK